MFLTPKMYTLFTRVQVDLLQLEKSIGYDQRSYERNLSNCV